MTQKKPAKPAGFEYVVCIDARVTFPNGKPSREKLRAAIKEMKLDYLGFIADDFIDVDLVEVSKVSVSVFPYAENK